jgi:hypothetical protein
VPFPVASFLGRIKAVAVEVARLYLTTQPTVNTSSTSSSSSSAPACSIPPDEVVALVHMHLFGSQPTPDSANQTQGTTSGTTTDPSQQDAAAEHPPATSSSSSTGRPVAPGLRLQPHPKGWKRSALPPRALVDHPGVWEDARGAYLHEVLVRRRGHPAALGIIFVEVGCCWWSGGGGSDR